MENKITDKIVPGDMDRRGRMIADMAVSERPREKAMAHGFDVLTDAELLAILFSTGTRDMNVVQLSEKILQDNGGHLSRLVRMNVRDITARYKGIGPAKALTLLAALQLGIRAVKDGSVLENKPVRSSSDIYARMRASLEWLGHEEFWVLYLSKSNEVISERMVGKGGLDATVVYVRVIMRDALLLSASAVAFVHNHPSGNMKPSIQDKALTEKLAEAARMLDIRVLDHIIVGGTKGYFSFCDEGLL